MKHLIVVLLPFLLFGCTTDISKDPSRRTDYMLGATYELQRPAYLSGDFLFTKRARIAGATEGELAPSTKLAVRKVTYYHLNPETGSYTSVYAEILTGEHCGQTVNISFLTGSAFQFVRQDPEIIQRVR